MAQHELRVIVVIPLSDEPMARSKEVASYETMTEELRKVSAQAGGSLLVNVVKAKPRPARVGQVTTTVDPALSTGTSEEAA